MAIIPLSLQTFNGWVQQQAAAVQSSARSLLDFTAGSAIRAIIEANASVALWMQWLILLVMARTRAATSATTDLDSWMADFSLTRLAAVAATGTVTFSRFTPTATALIIPGVQAKTLDGTQIFTVTTDTANSIWNAGLGGYLIPAASASGSVPVVAVNAGIQGNVQAATIGLIGSAIAGVDTVTNAVALTNGVDAESDVALRGRFANYINTRSRATLAAIQYAIASVSQVLTYTIQENKTPGGATQMGNFVVTVDDGSGVPSADTLAIVTAAVDPYRPIGSTFSVQAPSVVSATVAFTITVAAGYIKSTMIPIIQTAVTDYINALPLGSALAYSRIAQVAYDATLGIVNVTGVLLNGATADLGGGATQVVRAVSVTAS